MKKATVQMTFSKKVNAISGISARGILLGFDPEGVPLVDYPGNPTGNVIPSPSTVKLTEQDCGRDAVLLFEGGDPAKPILVGLIDVPVAGASSSGDQNLDVKVDGKRIEIEGQDEVVLRCGKASITLRRNGRVVIRGNYVESRSKGTNRIKGGSVLIN